MVTGDVLWTSITTNFLDELYEEISMLKAEVTLLTLDNAALVAAAGLLSVS